MGGLGEVDDGVGDVTGQAKRRFEKGKIKVRHHSWASIRRKTEGNDVRGGRARSATASHRDRWLGRAVIGRVEFREIEFQGLLATQAETMATARPDPAVKSAMAGAADADDRSSGSSSARPAKR